MIEQVLDDKMYTLCFVEDKGTAKNGKAFAEWELEK